MDDHIFFKFSELVYEFTGIHLNIGKKIMLIGRLSKRLRKHNIESYEDYFSFLITNELEKQEFINSVTTNETQFFRTPRVWDYILKQFLPSWHQTHKGETLNIWSAACATGDEVYSLACLCEVFKSTSENFKYSILGTDVSIEMIQVASEAVYPAKKLENFKKLFPSLLEKYTTYEPENNQYIVSSVLKHNVRLKQQNLFKIDKTTNKFDLILLRNVFIYFKAEDQEKILRSVESVMKEHACLIMGESESLIQLRTNLGSVEPLIYQLKTKVVSRSA